MRQITMLNQEVLNSQTYTARCSDCGNSCTAYDVVAAIKQLKHMPDCNARFDTPTAIDRAVDTAWEGNT